MIHSDRSSIGIIVAKGACLLSACLLLAACVTSTSSGSFSREVSEDDALRDYLQLSRGYLEQGDLVNARRHLDNAERFDSNNSEVYGIRALIQSRQGDLELADRSFRRSLQLDAGNSQNRNNYAAFLFANGRYQEAYEQLEIVVADVDYRARAQAFENLGLAALRLDRREDAQYAFGRALQVNPNQIRSIIELSELHLRGNELGQAQRYYQNYLTLQDFYNLSPTSRTLWLGIQLARAGGDSAREQELASMLTTQFPEAFETRLYRQSLNNE